MFYSTGTGSYLDKGKTSGDKADHLPESSQELKNTWICTSIPSYLDGMVLN
jgi:hypothetical protein